MTPPTLTILSCLILVSCGNFNPSALAKKSVNSISKLIPSRVPVAHVRSKDLKKLPTGTDLVKEWKKKQDTKRYASYTPVSYNAPTLPSIQSQPADIGLLPPLNPPSQEPALEEPTLDKPALEESSPKPSE